MNAKVIAALIFLLLLLPQCAERTVPTPLGDSSEEIVLPVCGDGVCEVGESSFGCIQDCGSPGNLLCYAKACSDAYTACMDLKGCAASLSCWLGCEDDAGAVQCMADCAEGVEGADRFVLDAFSHCADQSGCAGQAEEDTESSACGDGLCEPWEIGLVCPLDCPPEDDPIPRDRVRPEEEEQPEEESEEGEIGVAVMLSCLSEQCPDEMEACLGDPGCSGGIACAEGCGDGDTQCLQSCLMGGGLSGPTISLGLCAMDSGCFGETDEPPSEEEPVCGDGVCEEGEDCPEDCSDEGGVGDLVGCLTSECGEEIFTCFADPECQAALFCMIGCGSDFACLPGCFANGGFSQEVLGLGICAVSSPCLGGLLGGGGEGGGSGEAEEACGDGSCDGLEFLTCPDDCG